MKSSKNIIKNNIFYVLVTFLTTHQNLLELLNYLLNIIDIFC